MRACKILLLALLPAFAQGPAAPTTVTALAGNTTATVLWAAPSSSSGITGYEVTASPGGRACTTTMTTCVVTGLANGTAYTFAVRASDSAGPGAPSAPSPTVVPTANAGAPSAPTSVMFTASQNGTVFVTWIAPSGNPTAYTVHSVPGGYSCSTTGATNCSIADVMLTAFASCSSPRFFVIASNANGQSPPSADPGLIILPIVTSPPGNVTATADTAGGAVLSWSAASSPNCGYVAGYRVTRTPGNVPVCTVAAPTMTCKATGLEPGTTYTFSVVATRAGGEVSSDPGTVSYQTPAGPSALQPAFTHPLHGRDGSWSIDPLGRRVEAIPDGIRRPATPVLTPRE